MQRTGAAGQQDQLGARPGPVCKIGTRWKWRLQQLEDTSTGTSINKNCNKNMAGKFTCAAYHSFTSGDDCLLRHTVTANQQIDVCVVVTPPQK